MANRTPEERIAEYKEKAVAAKMAGDLQTAADWYYKAARLADFDSASEYARIAFPHLYDPIPKKAAANGKKICKWENHTYSKLNMKLYRERSEEIKFQKRLEAHQKIAAKYDHPMMDQFFGSFYNVYYGIKGEAENYFKKAAELGDYVAAGKLIYYYGKNIYNPRMGKLVGVQDMEQFWKYVFLTYELSKQRLAWFTHGGFASKYQISSFLYKHEYQLRLLGRMANDMCDSVLADLFPEIPPSMGEPDENAVEETDYGCTRDKFYDYATLSEEDKESLFLWLRAICDTFPNLDNIYDDRRHFLCYMYAEGYGCKPDTEKARQVVKNVPMMDGSVKNAIETYDRYDHDYKKWRIKPIVAYFLAEQWVENGENLEQAKAWLTRVTTDSMWEKYRVAAQELLDKLG